MDPFTIFVTVVSIISGVASYQQAKKIQREVDRESRGVEANIESNIKAIPVVYGERRVGGVRVYIDTSKDIGNKYLYMVMAMAEGEVEDIHSIEIDDVPITDEKFILSGLGANFTYEIFYGSDTQGASDLIIDGVAYSSAAEVPPEVAIYLAGQEGDKPWNQNHTLNGVAYLAMRFLWDSNAYNGVPNVTAIVKGKKVYDPRNPTAPKAWSSNPALCIRDYLTSSRYGKGIPESAINDVMLAQAANDYDSFVVTPYDGGDDITLFEMNTVVDTEVEIIKNLNDMLMSCRGFLPYVDGKYGMRVDQATNHVMEVNSDHIIGGISIAGTKKEDRFNQVKVNFFNKDKEYKEDTAVFPDVDDPSDVNNLYQTYLAEDGGEPLVDDIKIDGISNYYTAREMAKLFLLRSRLGTAIAFRGTSELMELEVGDTFLITQPTPAWTNKKFQVQEIGLNFDGTVNIQAIEYSDAIYTYNTASEETPFVPTKLPNPNKLAPVTAASASAGSYIDTDGRTVPFIDISWTAPNDALVDRYEIKYTIDNEDVIYSAIAVDTSHRIVEAKGTYDIEIYAVNGFGSKSTGVTLSDVVAVADTSAPSDITGISISSALQSISLTWTNPTEDDFDLVRIKVADKNAVPTTHKFEVRSDSFVHDIGAYSTEKHYWLAPVDRTGNVGNYVSGGTATTGSIAIGDVPSVAGTFYLTLDDDDAPLDAEFKAVVGRNPVDNDFVVVNKEFAFTYSDSDSDENWTAVTEFIDGSLLVTGSLSASDITTGTLDANNVTISNLTISSGQLPSDVVYTSGITDVVRDGDISGLALLLNKQADGTANVGEGALVGRKADGNVALNTDGYIIYNGSKITIPRGTTALPNITILTGLASKKGFIVLDSTLSNKFEFSGSYGNRSVVFAFKDGSDWKYDNNGTAVTFTPTDTDLVLGYLETSTADLILNGGLFGEPLPLIMASEQGATVGADWDSNLTNAPTNIVYEDYLYGGSLLDEDVRTLTIPNPVDIDSALEYTINVPSSTRALLVMQILDAEGVTIPNGVQWALNGVYQSQLNGADNATVDYKFEVNLNAGDNSIKIWSGAGDGGTVYFVKAYTLSKSGGEWFKLTGRANTNAPSDYDFVQSFDRLPLPRDVILVEATNGATTNYQYSGGTWDAIEALINGDLLVTDSITALGEVTAGTFSLGSGKFAVNSSGQLSATDAIISGNITADSLDVEDATITGTLTAPIGWSNSVYSGVINRGNLSESVKDLIDERIAEVSGGISGDFGQDDGSFNLDSQLDDDPQVSNITHESGKNITIELSGSRSWNRTFIGLPVVDMDVSISIQRSLAGADSWSTIATITDTDTNSSITTSTYTVHSSTQGYSISIYHTIAQDPASGNYDYRAITNDRGLAYNVSIPLQLTVVEPATIGAGNADTLDNQDGTYYLNYNNFTNTPTLITQTDINNSISALVDSAPATLDTLNELAAALGDNANFAQTTATALGSKLPKSGSDLYKSATYPTNTFIKQSSETAYTGLTIGSVGGLGLILDTNDNDVSPFLISHGATDIDSATEMLRLDEDGLTLSKPLADDNVFLTLSNQDSTADLSIQRSFVDFKFVDSNTNFTPQVRIGAEVGESDGDADSAQKEGSGAFVVYTSTGTSSTAGTLSEKFRVQHDGVLKAGANTIWHSGNLTDHTTAGYITSIPTPREIAYGNSTISGSNSFRLAGTGIQTRFSLVGYNEQDTEWEWRFTQADDATPVPVNVMTLTPTSSTSANLSVTGTISASGYNNTNWDTAYGWGNHASAGYLTSVPSEYLTQTEGDGRYALPSSVVQTIYQKEMNTTSAGYVSFEFTGYVNTIGRDYYIFDVIGYKDFRDAESFVHYTVYLNCKGAFGGTLSDNTITADVVARNQSADANLTFKLERNLSPNNTHKLWIGIDEGYSGIQILHYPTYIGDLTRVSASSFAFTSTEPTTTTVFPPSIPLLSTGGTMTGDLTLNSATPQILFNGTSDAGVDMAIKATPEGLDFYEPEDNNKVHFQILDDTGVNSPFGYKVGGVRKDLNWDTAYTYSQVGHLPLTGGTLTGGLSISGYNTISSYAGSFANLSLSGGLTVSSVSTIDAARNANFANLSYSGSLSNGSIKQEWTTNYVLNKTTPKELLYSNGQSLPNGGVYRFSAHISGTGTDNWATAVYWNQNGTWKLNVTQQSGTLSNNPEFVVISDVPTLIIDHSNNYTVHVFAERLELNEGGGTDNNGGFGADAFLSNVGGALRHNPYGSGTNYTTGDRVFTDGYHPNADKWTTAKTITLGGDLTGSVSIDGSANVTLSAQVVNDSHSHSNYLGVTRRIGCSNAGAGWYRVALSTASSGRGSFQISLFGYGGTNSPQEVVIRGTMGYGTTAPSFISIENARGSRATKVRGVQDGGYAYIEVYFPSPFTDLGVACTSFGIGNFRVTDTSTLSPATGTESAVSLEYDIVSSGKVLFGDTKIIGSTNTTGSYQIDGNTVIDSSRNATFNSITGSGGLTLTGGISASGYNNTNWDTAHGWGNHASAGYLTSIPTPTSSNWWNGYVGVGGDGVMEMGKYMDFHTTSSGGDNDHDLRVTVSTGVFSVGGKVNATDGYQVGTTTVIDSSRNLTNIDDASIGTGSANFTRYSSGGLNVPDLQFYAGGKTGWGVDDELGKIRWYIADGSGVGNRDAVRIVPICETGNGTSTTTFSGGLAFHTSASNAQPRETIRFDSNGNLNVKIGDYQINGTAVIDSSRNATFANLTSSGTTSFTVTGITDLNAVPNSSSNTFVPFISEFQASNISGSNYNGGFWVGARAGGYGSQMTFQANGATTPPYVRNLAGGTWGDWQKILTNKNPVESTTDANHKWYTATTNTGSGVVHEFSDQVPNTQKGYFKYFHSDTRSHGSGNAFTFTSTETALSFAVDGKIISKDGFYVGFNSSNSGTQVIDSNRNAFFGETVELGNINETNQKLNIKYRTNSSGYGAVRFYENTSNRNTIHSFSSTWQSGSLSSTSTDAINISGGTGVTFGSWDNVSAYITNAGDVSAKNSLQINGTTVIDSSRNGYLADLDLTGRITMQAEQFINRRFEMIENAATQYILLCANAGNNDVNGSIRMDRTSGNWQAVNLDVVVSSRSAGMNSGTLRTLQVIQSNERYKLVKVTYNSVNYIAIKYTGNAYPMTNGAYFTGRLKSTVAGLVVVSSGITNESDFTDGTTYSYCDSDRSDYKGILTGDYVRGNRLYANAEGSTGYFYNDTGARVSFTGGDFYIQSDVTNTYIYSTNTYLGNSSGDTIHFRSNTVSGTNWGVDSTGNLNAYSLKVGGQTVIDSSRNIAAVSAKLTGDLHILKAEPRIILENTAETDAEIVFNDYQAGNYPAASSQAFKMRWSAGDNIFRMGHDGGYDNLSMDVGGNVTVSGNVTAYSDARLKDNVKTLDGSKVYEMRGVSFTKDGELGSGVIAQELEQVAPELVMTNDDEMQTKSVAYGNVVGYLIEAIKELKQEIEELKNGTNSN
jgi:hypothetical protein